jgi:hypothetical protein
MTDFEAPVPIYYVVKPNLTDDEVAVVQHSLTFTPIAAVIIINAYDGEQANKFSNKVIQASTLDSAHEMARAMSVDRAVLIIAGDETFAGVYEDIVRAQ